MIKTAAIEDLSAIAKLAHMLWPEHTLEDLEEEFGAILSSQEAMISLCFLQDAPIGFAQCQLRFDYVEGTKSSPVGYLEGIYVTEANRKEGIARELLLHCQRWAKEKGCTEFASDCELTNTESLQFHLHMGFVEANRMICFQKYL